MGFADGFYYGQGRFIVDTTGVAVGTDYKVKSMTDNTKSWTKSVVTSGVPLVFDVPCKDYYKICQMTEVDDEPVEVGGIYKTVDYGQTQFINVLDKKSLAGIQGILDAHQETEYLAIGDEVNVTIDGVDEPFLVAAIDLYDSHEVIFVAKYGYDETPVESAYYHARNYTLNFLNNMYANMADKDKKYLKSRQVVYAYTTANIYRLDQKIWIPSFTEVFNNMSLEYNNGVRKYPIFGASDTGANASRIRTLKGGTAKFWATASSCNYNNYADYTDQNGAWNYGNYQVAIVPCFHLTADV